LHNKLTGTAQCACHPVSICEAADNTLPTMRGVHTSAVGLPQGLSKGSCWGDQGGSGIDDDDGDWAIQAWAEEQPAALWMSQEVREQFVVQCKSSQRRSDVCDTE